ncbi:MAG: Na+/solute symporter [uncultured Paraburkholderia sp.]|nr:MAG: Na+/solute symporter [uncultured Paraburkholderia sp.]
MNAIATFVFVLFFIGVTILGFIAAHWRRGDLAHLEEWGLGGRRFGTIVRPTHSSPCRRSYSVRAQRVSSHCRTRS